MANELFCLFGAHWHANCARDVTSAHQPSEIVTLEIELDELGFVFAKKALFANRFNYTDAMPRMINAVTLINSDDVLLVLVVESIFIKNKYNQYVTSFLALSQGDPDCKLFWLGKMV
ncbi:hypothetical protein [Marinobacter sp.]|uniref:hypothetical protein n=1 Tax=Marinobacter sp. TaxID=50741 RepID=UPI003A8F439B